jgi:hypothetical protein
MNTTKRVVIAITVLLVLLIGGIVTREAYLAATATPVISIDYAERINARVREANASFPTPQGDFDTFTHILRELSQADHTLAAAAFPGQDSPMVPYDALYTPSQSAENRALAERGLAEHIASGRLESLSQLPGLVGVSRKLPSDGLLLGVTLPELRDARNAARILAARFVIAAREGREEDATAELERLVSLGMILTHQATLIDRLVGCAVHSVAIDAIRDLHAQGHMSGSLAARLLPVMQRINTRPSYALQLNSERDSTLDVIQRTHSRQGRFIPSEYTRILGGFSPLKPWQLSAFLPRKAETEALANTYYDGVIEAATQPVASRQFTTLDAIADSDSTSPVIKAMIPALSRTLASEDQLLTTLHGVQILLGLEIHRARTGAYPQSLNELVPGVFTQLPVDVIAKDGSFKYVLRPAEVTTGRPFLLYSIGRDQTDNQGNPHPKVDVTALNLSKDHAGFDYVVNRTRPDQTPPPNAP